MDDSTRAMLMALQRRLEGWATEHDVLARDERDGTLIVRDAICTLADALGTEALLRPKQPVDKLLTGCG